MVSPGARKCWNQGFSNWLKQQTLFSSRALTDLHSSDSNSRVCLKSCTVSGGGGGREGVGWWWGGGPRFPPSPSGAPRGATMAMVIMSPLSELTDTDGFEMRSISQRAPRHPSPSPPRLGTAGPRVCQAPLSRVSSYHGLTARPSSIVWVQRRLLWLTSGPLLVH